MHEIWPIAIDDSEVCLSVCLFVTPLHSASACTIAEWIKVTFEAQETLRDPPRQGEGSEGKFRNNTGKADRMAILLAPETLGMQGTLLY